MKQLRQQVSLEDKSVKKKEYDEGPKASFGYGGQFGVQKDRMDKVRNVLSSTVRNKTALVGRREDLTLAHPMPSKH